MPDQRYPAIGFFGTIAILLSLMLVSLVWGTPEYPFTNTQMFGAGIPGWDAIGSGSPGTCRGHNIFQFNHKEVGGSSGWQTWVQAEGGNMTAAYFVDVTVEDGAKPIHVVFGTYSEANGHITITESVPYDSTKHLSPCQDWK